MRKMHAETGCVNEPLMWSKISCEWTYVQDFIKPKWAPYVHSGNTLMLHSFSQIWLNFIMGGRFYIWANFHSCPSSLKNDTCFQSGQKRPKNKQCHSLASCLPRCQFHQYFSWTFFVVKCFGQLSSSYCFNL